MSLLATSQSELFLLFENTPDLVCIAGKDGYFKNLNRAAIAKLGYTKTELMAQPISSFIHPEDRERTSRHRNLLLKGKALINFDNRYVTKTGAIIWLNWTSTYLAEQELVFAIAKDITTRKEAELEIQEKYWQSRKLAEHFKKSLEKDKKFLAAELHEQLAQLASAIKIDINWLNENLSGSGDKVQAHISRASSTTEILIDSIRKLSYSISPGMIDDLGLNETLRWLADEFTLLNGIPCKFETTYNDQLLSSEIQLDFFRICQESLKNILEHANASNASITLHERGNEVCLSIADNGKGFDIKSFDLMPGLTAIRERALSINGSVTFESELGKGTVITVCVAN